MKAADPAPEKERLKEDLRLTLRELSDSYEELSLLYRMSESFSGGVVEDICENMLDEVTGLFETTAAAIVFLDESGEAFYTKSCRGRWDKGRTIDASDALWPALNGRSICRRVDGGGPGALLICPLGGKKKAIGAMLVAADGEVYSGEMKLLRAIVSQAALFMENAMLYKELEEFFLNTIGSYVKAIEAASGWTAGHTERVTEYALGMGREMGLDPAGLERLRISGMLHDIGKIAVRSEVLNKQETLRGDEWDEIRKHPRTGAEILGRIKAFSDIVGAVRYHHEYWDGSGAYGLRGEDIPLMARILSVADAFDAMTSDRPYKQGAPAKEAEAEIVRNSGIQFDPEVVRAFIRWRTASSDDKPMGKHAALL